MAWAGVADAARERDVNLVCFASGIPAFSPLQQVADKIIYDLVTPENTNGLIISSTMASHVAPEEFRAFCNRYCGRSGGGYQLPTIGIGIAAPGILGVLPDNEKGLRDLLIHLIEDHGYRRLAFICGPEGNEDAERRYRIYTDVLTNYGLPLIPNLVVPGDFLPATGAAGIQMLFDERKARFEAVVAANDLMALGAIRALQARGIRVPYDIAVTGFDDLSVSKATIPSLTTVRQPIYEMGKLALETVLALLAKERLPETITLPTELVVRRSCGCFHHAAAITPSVAGERAARVDLTDTAKDTPAERQEGVLLEMALAAGNSIEEQQNITTWSDQLLDAFVSDLRKQRVPSVFLQILDQVLRQAITHGQDLTSWHRAISVLCRHTLLDLPDQENLTYAVDLWQQAWMLIGDMREQVPTSSELEALEQFARSLNVSQTLGTALDEAALMNMLARMLPPLGIPGCYIVLYEDTQSPLQWARLVLAYAEDGRLELEEGGKRFPTLQLVPDGVLSSRRAHNLLVEPLYFKNEQFGFAIFEIESPKQLIYVTLHAQISSALKSAQLVRQVESRAHELEARNAELNAFAHTVAHDLKTPLSTLVLWSTMLEECHDEMTSEDIDTILHRIARAGYKLTSIVNSLLLLSSVRQEDVEVKPLNMVDVVADAQKRLADIIVQRQAEVITPNRWPTVMGYAPWVEEIWVNYISNAVKYGGRPAEGVPPRVELGFDEPANAHVRFWVHDNGPGLTPQEQEQLFTPFIRLHQVRVEGHGLGLSIVRRIVEKLGGKVGVESKVGKGSIFYFTLPTPLL